MSDLIGDVKERQRLAFEWPIWRLAQAQDQLFRYQSCLPTGLWLQSVLTVDCFVEPHCWHCAVGFLRKPAKFNTPVNTDTLYRQMIELEAMPVAQWQRDEKALAISAARDLLAGVGELPSVSWTWAQYYDMTFQAWRKLTAEELENVQKKMAELGDPKRYLLPELPGIANQPRAITDNGIIHVRSH